MTCWRCVAARLWVAPPGGASAGAEGASMAVSASPVGAASRWLDVFGSTVTLIAGESVRAHTVLASAPGLCS